MTGIFVLWVDNAGAAPDIKEAREISRSIIARCKHRHLALASVAGPWRRRSQRAVPATTDLVEKLRAQNVAFEAIGTLPPQHPREILPRSGDGVNREPKMSADVTL